MKPAEAERFEPHAPLVKVWAQPMDGRAGQFEEVAEETPVALALNGVSQAVMMATPSDLEDFAFGSALTEGWIDHRHQVLDVEIQPQDAGVVVDLATTAACEHRQPGRCCARATQVFEVDDEAVEDLGLRLGSCCAKHMDFGPRTWPKQADARVGC